VFAIQKGNARNRKEEEGKEGAQHSEIQLAVRKMNSSSNATKTASFQASFQLPRRKLCYKACMPAPGIPNTLLITQIIESTKEAGDISGIFSGILKPRNEAGY